MNKLKIEYLPVEKLNPYDKNARKHTDDDVKYIVNSIEKFGFDDPIGIWGDGNVIVEGHGRLIAAKQLGMTEVPVIRLDHLTDEERRAYTLAHNKTAEMSDWDFPMLESEIDDIEKLIDLNMEDFGFEFKLDEIAEPEKNDDGEEIEYVSNAEYVFDKFNLKFFHKNRATDWGFPTVRAVHASDIPEDFLDFNNMPYYENHVDNVFDFGIRFYQDDSKEDKIWNNPQMWADRIARYRCAVSPDFSTYNEMPIIVKQFNAFKCLLIAQIIQDAGTPCIVDISDLAEESLRKCYDGVERGGIYSMSAKGGTVDSGMYDSRFAALDYCLENFNPEGIIVFGLGLDDYDWTKWKGKYVKRFRCDNFYRPDKPPYPQFNTDG